MYKDIPKHWLTDIYLGDEGPLAGKYARQCPCHEAYEEDEPCVLVATQHALVLMHRRCMPSSYFEDDDE